MERKLVPEVDVQTRQSGIEDRRTVWDSARVAAAVARLGYPQFRNLESGPREDPAVLLIGALCAEDLEARVVEALPWLAIRFHELDWNALIGEAMRRGVQNRLGFIASVGRQVAESRGNAAAARALRRVEELAGEVRLHHEDTLCHSSLSPAERRWLRNTRPADACHWNLLTDLIPEHLDYGE